MKPVLVRRRFSRGTITPFQIGSLKKWDSCDGFISWLCFPQPATNGYKWLSRDLTWLSVCFINFCVYYAVIQEYEFVCAAEFALTLQFSSTNTTPSSNSLKLKSETPFSTLLFALSLPPLPCQHHVCPGRSMWQAAGIMLTFSAPCSSASLIQTSQSTVHHLGQRRSETTWEPDITQ